MTNQVSAPGVRTNSHGFSVDFAAVGTVLSYTPPANKRAEITGYVAQGQGATTATTARISTGGNLVELTIGAAATAVRQGGASWCLDPGETFEWRVTAATALDTGDVFVSIVEEI